MVTDDPVASNVSATPSVPSHPNRFQPGNTFGTRKLHTQRASQFRKAFQSAVTDEEMALMAKQMVQIALAGDVAAARFVAEYTMGKPLQQEVEMDASSTPGQLVINLVTPETKN
jgi:hypothetical protein